MFKNPEWASLIDAKLADGVVLALSMPRLSAYGSLPIESVARHGRNITLCEATYPVLHLLEVVMRNRIHDAFSVHFGALDGYDQGWLTASHRRFVEDAKSDLSKKRRHVSPDGVIAALSFGFWCGMFSWHYEQRNGAWPALLRNVVPRVPKSWATRAKVQTRVEEAREIRNRVFHHEPLQKSGSLAGDLLDRHRRLVELLGWFSADARMHLEHLCRFKTAFFDQLEPGGAKAAAAPPSGRPRKN